MVLDPDKPNVVNLAEARKRQRTVRAGASGRGDQAKKAPPAKLWTYLQVALFLVIIAYLMQKCHGG